MVRAKGSNEREPKTKGQQKFSNIDLDTQCHVKGKNLYQLCPVIW